MNNNILTSYEDENKRITVHYKKPKADVYKEKNGEYKLYSTYQ